MEKIIPEINKKVKNDVVRIYVMQNDVDRIIMILEDSEFPEDSKYLINQLRKHASEFMGGKVSAQHRRDIATGTYLGPI